MSANLFPAKKLSPQQVGLLSAAIPSPFGDALGLLADTAGYIQDPSSLTPGRGLLSLAALAPGIPNRAAIMADTGKRWFKAKALVEGGQTFKNPVHLKDGRRLSGFNDPNQQYFYGYDKNGVQFTWGRNSLSPDDIDWSRDGSKTAEFLRSMLIGN